MKNLLCDLCCASSFYKSDRKVSDVIIRELSKYAKVKSDFNGNIIATMGNFESKKNIMLDAHCDQIGFIVTHIKNGFIKIANCGGVDVRMLPGLRVKIYGNQPVIGIICTIPPHIEKGEKELSIDDIVIDTGLTAEKASSLIEIGDFVGFDESPSILLENRIAAPALDNRVGVATLLQVAKNLSKKKLDCKVTIVFSNCEETTGAGAKTAAYEVNADEAIVVDVSFARQPGIPHSKSAELASGPMIGISPSLSSDVYTKLINIAKNQKIKYNIEPMNGRTGTNADYISISRNGVRTGLVSVPIRYMHTTVEVVDMCDIKNSSKLITKYIVDGGATIE